MKNGAELKFEVIVLFISSFVIYVAYLANHEAKNKQDDSDEERRSKCTIRSASFILVLFGVLTILLHGLRDLGCLEGIGVISSSGEWHSSTDVPGMAMGISLMVASLILVRKTTPAVATLSAMVFIIGYIKTGAQIRRLGKESFYPLYDVFAN